jgi:hypothetical protein
VIVHPTLADEKEKRSPENPSCFSNGAKDVICDFTASSKVSTMVLSGTLVTAQMWGLVRQTAEAMAAHNTSIKRNVWLSR